MSRRRLLAATGRAQSRCSCRRGPSPACAPATLRIPDAAAAVQVDHGSGGRHRLTFAGERRAQPRGRPALTTGDYCIRIRCWLRFAHTGAERSTIARRCVGRRPRMVWTGLSRSTSTWRLLREEAGFRADALGSGHVGLETPAASLSRAGAGATKLVREAPPRPSSASSGEALPPRQPRRGLVADGLSTIPRYRAFSRNLRESQMMRGHGLITR